MANYSSQYTFGISADTKMAQSSVNALTKSLRDIQSKRYQVQIDTQRINEASEAAATLRTALSNAMNVDTGKLNLTKFSNELKSAGTSVGELGSKLLNAGTQGQQAFSQLTHTIASAEAPVKKFNTALSSIGTTLLNTIKWQAASSLIHGLMSTISGAIGYARNLNSTLTDIRVVTGMSSDQMAKFAKTANEAARELSTTTNEFAKASLIFYQQGDSAELAAKKAAIVTKAANVAFTASAQEMSEMLTAVWNSYQMGEDQLEHAVDVIAKLGATTASSMEEMATGMQKVAATANNVGVSMEQMAAMIATSASVTRQAPQTIGTAWNTVLSRLGGLKLGETLEDGVDLNKYSKALKTIGVDILDASGELRNMGEIVDEIGAKWDFLTKAQQSALAQTVGGVRQYTQIMAFFDNFDKYQKNMATAQNSNGALNEQQEIYAEGWEAASNRAQAAVEKLYQQLINDKAIISLKNFFATILNIGTSIADTFGGLGNVITLIGTALVNANIDKISTWISEAGTSIKQLFSGNQEINEYAATLQQMRSEMEGLISRDDVASSAKTELQYDIQILSMKEQLAKAQDKLTAKQKEQAQQYIQNMEASKQYYTSMMQSQEETIKKMETAKKSMAASIKENIATQKIGGHKDASYIDQQSDLRTANHLVTDILPDEAYEKLQQAALLMGTIKDASQEVTADKLVETLEKANQEAGKFSAVLDRIDESFTLIKDASGKEFYDIKSFTGSDEARKAVLESMANSAASSSNPTIAAQGQAQLDALSTIDPSNAQALQQVLNALVPLLNEAGAAAQKAADDTKDAGEKAGATKEELDDLGNSARETGRSVGQLADDAALAGKNIEEKFKASITSAKTTIQGFVTTAMTLTRVTTAISAISNAVDKLSDPDVSGWQKFVTIISTFSSVAFAAKSIMDALSSSHKGLIAQTWKSMVAAASDTAAQTVHSAAYMAVAGAVKAADTAIKGFMASNPIGWILAVVAAVVALIAIIVSLAASDAAEKKWSENMVNRQKDLKDSMDKTAEASDKLATDMQTLQDVMKDTNLTYEEQLNKINEICEAYGVQATMLDVLSGNYTRLATAMTGAARTESENIVNQAEANANTAHQLAGERSVHNNGRNFWSFGRDVLNAGTLGAFDMIESGDLSEFRWEYLIPFYGQYLAATDAFNATFNDPGQAFYKLNKHDSVSGGEASALRAHESELNSWGYSIDRKGQLVENEDGKGNGAALLQLLQSDEDFAEFREASDSYISRAIGVLTEAGYDIEVQANEALEQARLTNSIWQNADFDPFGLNGETSVQDVAKLIADSPAKTQAEREYMARYIGGFDNYSEAGAQYRALNTLSGSAANVQMQLHPEITNKEELTSTILSDLLEGEEISTDVLLRINPTDIVLNTTTGKYTIDTQARKLAEDKIAIEAAQTRRETLDEQKKLMTGKSFKPEDYETLKASGLFSTDEELLTFMQSNQGTREVLWQNMYDSAVQAEMNGYDAAIADAEARIPQIKGKLKEWYSDLDQYVLSLIADSVLNDDELAEIDGLSGEALYGKLTDIRARHRSTISTNQAQLDTYTTLKTNGSTEGKDSFARQLGYDKWEGHEEDIARDMAAAQNLVNQSTAVVERLDSVLVRGDELATELGDAQTTLEESRTGKEATSQYTEYTAQVTKATTAAGAFTEAIGKQKTASSELLGKLVALDDKALEYYQTMSESQWNEYAYNQAMKYYDDLIAAYRSVGDEANALAAEQEKLTVQQTYWNSVGEKATKNAERIKEAYDTITDAATSAQSILSKLIDSNDWSNITAKNLDGLAEALRKIGWEEEKILELQNKLLNGEVESKEKIFATLEAETNAALEALLTYSSEQAEYSSLTSGASLHVSATVDEIVDQPVPMSVDASTSGQVTVGEGHDKVNLRATVTEIDPESPLLGPHGEITLPALIQIANAHQNGQSMPEELQSILDEWGVFAIDGVIQWSQDLIDAGYMTVEGQLDFDKIEADYGTAIREKFESEFSEGGYFSIPAAINFMKDNRAKYFGDSDGDGKPDMDVKGSVEILKMYGANINTDDPNNPWFNIYANLLDILDPNKILEGKTIEVTPVLANTDAFQLAYDLEMWRVVQDYYEGKLAQLTDEKTALETEIAEKQAAGEDTTDLELRLDVVEAGIQNVQGQLDTTNTKVADLETQLKTLREEKVAEAEAAQASADTAAETAITARNAADEAQAAADEYTESVPELYKAAGMQPLPSDYYDRQAWDQQQAAAAQSVEADTLVTAAEEAQATANTAWEVVEALTDTIGDADTYENPRQAPKYDLSAPAQPTPTPGPTNTPGPQATAQPTIINVEEAKVESKTAKIDTSTFTSRAQTSANDAINRTGGINRFSYSNPNGLLRTAQNEGSAQAMINSTNLQTFGIDPKQLIQTLWKEMSQLDLTNEADQALWLIGQYMIQGLINSISGGIDSLESLKPILGQAFWDTFAEPAQVNSPSRLTMKIGEYLIQGLNVGVQNSELDFGDLAKGMTNEFMGAIAAVNYDQLDAALMSYVTKHLDYSKIKMTTSGQIDWTNSDNLAQVDEQLVNFFKSPDWLNEFATFFGEDWSEWKSSAVQAAKAAADKKIGELGSEDVDSTEWFNEFYSYFNTQINDLQTKIDSVTTNLKQSWANAALSIYNNEVNLAQQTYDLWEKTFNAIAKVRTDVFTQSDKSIMEVLYKDADSLDALINTLMTRFHMTLDEAMKFLSNPELTEEDKNKLFFTPFEESAWLDSGAQKYLPRNANGTIDRSYNNEDVIAAWRANLDTDITRIVTELFQGGKTFESYQANIANLQDRANSGDSQAAEILSSLAKAGYVIQLDNGQYAALDETNFETSQFFENIEGLVRASLNKTDSEILGLYRQAATKEDQSKFTNADNLQTAAKNIVSQKNSDLELLHKAREELLKEDGDLSTALNDSEQERLKELTGASSLAEVGLNQVNSAAYSAAQALETLAKAVPQAMGMVQRGEADSWSIDSDTGEVTVSQFSQTKQDTWIAEQEAAWKKDNPDTLSYQGGQEAYEEYMAGVRAKADEMKASGEFNETVSLSGPSVEVDDDVKNGAGAVNDEDLAIIEAYASAVGYTKEEFVEYRDELLAASGETRKFTELSGLEKQQLLELTRQAAAVQNAWSNLKKNVANWNKTMDTAVEGSKEWKDALKDMTKETKAFFGGSTKVTDTWVKNHRKDIEKAVEGDEAALERLQDDLINLELGANKDYVVTIDGKATKLNSVIDDFEDRFKNLQDGAVITPEIDTSGATGALVDLINQGGETANQIMAALNAIGWTPEIEMEEVPISEEDMARGQVSVPIIKWIDGIPYYAGEQDIPIDGKMGETGKVQIPKIGSNGQVQVKGLKKTGAGQSSGKTPSSGSSGGGGKSAKKVESYKKGSDEKERYHEITAKLTEQGNLLTKLDKLKSRTFGAAHVKAINDEIAALDKEAKLYGDLAKEASTELEANKKILTSYGATFNKDGTINYEEYMDKILAQYNKAVDKYNNSKQDAGDELALKKAEEIYNEAKKAMEDYEEDMAKLNEAQENMLEYQNKISAAMLEGIQYKVEVQFDLNDRDVKQLQYLRNSWEDFLDKQDDSFTKMTEEALIYEDNLKILGASFDELNAAYADGTLNQADYASGMQDLNDKMLEQLENLLTIKKSIKEAYGNTLEMANQELEKYNSILEHSRNVMQSYIQMQQLMGLGADYSGLKEMYQMSLDASNASVAAAKQHLDVLKKSRADIEAQVEKYGWTDVLKQQWEDVNNAIIEGEDDLLSKTQQALEDAQAVFTNTMQSIIQDFDQTLFGMKNGLANLEDDYSYYQEEQARYLSTSKELYEVAKLNRQIDQSIADTTTKTSKERLKALQEQIKAQAESTRLTEYDVQMMELQYKHALALQELEDAKNAKSVVRLTRDENGNFGYQYTADDKGISDAQQKVDDALQQINELAANRVAEMEQAAVNAERQYRDSLLEIAQDTTLTLEERQAKMEELTRRHAETMQFNQEQYNNAQTALLTNQQYVYERYGVSIMTNTGLMQDQYNENIAKMMAKTEDYAQYLKAQMEPKGAIYEAMQKYKEDMELVTTTSGLGGWAGMTASVDEYRQANQEAQAAIAGIEKTLKETLANIDASTEKWNQHGAVLEAITARYEALAEAATDAVKEAAGNVAGTTVGGASTGAAQEHAQDEGTGQKHWRYIWGYEHFAGTEAGYDSKRAAEKGAIQDMKQKIYAALEAGETDAETAANKAKLDAIYEKALGTIITTAYKTGGLIDFTGPAWVDGSREQPELMLNSTDTRNLLRTVDLVREMDMETLAALYDSINQSALGMMYAMSGITAPSGGQSGELKQNVTITADFPNATDRNEISAAFEDLVNLAAQYANR